ncbi:hypothetical protein SOASR030_34470 [Leminorella grimontii]|uniref:L,D-TPase catalytic domain-containing protein n=1 Tax=Leminorella grimontii TaxID=82981 RepID=A0AAV5N6U7_9GAMM|nr:murein L,D-transpeptidase family protein [Leminorella grimontii]KFC93356.1 putative exported protein [Leminorella grimontii ATCC 33999 = DSM 5078]GKX57335.1 hypothetical protein SOASR030_34470 [Leminorella grimontii]VFS54837.1 Uncharacterized protein conserved in bacteria [Leminorella grimontii]
MKRWPLLLILLLCTVAAIFIYRYVTSDEGAGLMPDERTEPFPDGAQIKREIQPGDRLFIRILKAEDKLELWYSDGVHPFDKYKTYTICTYSGGLGPKKAEGDGKSPEGFYATNRGLLNPNSRYHLSFNIDYPNAYDRANGFTGSFIMVHGGCASVGCYAMTDPIIEEIYGLVEQALDGGQRSIPVHIFPFAMTDKNLERYRNAPEYPFWMMLKPGYDYFDKNRQIPVIGVENKRYRLIERPVG